ncbi:MAG: metalloregulator ArsR/SmtB family transcription factor [Euryarchaeota archaeon]|nr:metalloregulator ArsR/SmtB family transcription factor [Euryarchaeota archaeon]
MVDQALDLDATFQALAHPVRRAILSRLTEERDATVTALAEPFEMSLAGISKHLRVLQSAGLVQVEPHGRERHVRLDPGPLAAAEDWIEQHRRFWTERLDARDDLLRG